MIRPPLLKPGDTIGIVAPARKLTVENIDIAAKILKGWGLHVKYSQNLFSEKHSYFSGSDEERIQDFQSFLDDDSIQAILCARGGYGSTRIIDEINFSSLSRKPKWIIGFSDITAFHLKINSIGIMSVHGTMPILFGNSESALSIEALRTCLFYGIFEFSSFGSEKNRSGSASGRLIGGNLSLLVDSIGTACDTDMEDKILVIEEIDEYYYKVDRMMVQLKRAGKLSSLKGLVVGHMTDIKETTLVFGESIEEIILRAVDEYDYPVAFQMPTGHENPNFAWIEGGLAELVVDGRMASLKSIKEDNG